ncbi:MAG: hypothetical protein Q7R89_02195 [bacterium]|nr:hypothetical protein [bacterium]
MSKPSCVMVLRPDGLALTVKIRDNKIIADVRVIERCYDADSQELQVLVREKSYYQEFDISNLPWRAKSNIELLERWIRDKIEKSGFRKFSGVIARLAQELAEQSDAYDRIAAA